MAGGRPTKYKPEYCQDLIDFFNVEPYRELSDQNGKEYLMPGRFPTLAGWCGKKLISRQTLHEWVSVHPEFSDAYKVAKELQEDLLIRGGIAGAYATAFAVFTAKNAIGWRDKPIEDEQAEERAKRNYTVTLKVDDGTETE